MPINPSSSEQNPQEAYLKPDKVRYTELLGKQVSMMAFGTARIGGEKDAVGQFHMKAGQEEQDI